MASRKMDAGKHAQHGINRPQNVRTQFERASKRRGAGHYVLRLFVTGTSPRSTRAIENIRRLCEAYLRGRYKLEVVDVYQQPVLAVEEQIVAAPTLIKKVPLPLRRIIGDLSNEARVLMGLDMDDHAPRRAKMSHE